MKPHNRQNLVNEVLADDGLADFREASLQYGLATIRRRRKQLFLSRTLVLGLVPLLAAVGILLTHVPKSAVTTSLQISNQVQEQKREPSAQTKLITDEELFALFPNRPMALIGKPGEQQLVFLDQARNQTTELH